MSTELLSLLDRVEDVYPPLFDAEFCWREDPAPARPATTDRSGERNDYSPDAVDGQALIETLRNAPPATFGLSVVPGAPRVDPAPPPPARTLREGVDAIAQMVEEIDAIEQDEELTPAEREAATKAVIAALLPALAGTRKKVDSTNSVLAMYEHLVAAAKGERDRLTKRIRRFERCGERLTQYVLATLTASRLEQLDGETSTLTRRLNPASVVFVEGIDFEADLEDEFLRWKAEPDKVAIKAAIKAKREVPGASLVKLPKLVRS